MKRAICLVLLGLFSAAVIGCEASARVGDDDDIDGSRTYKKTTTVREPDGDYSKTEIRRQD